MRVIAHLDMDAFYASVELRRRPELRGKPMVVAGSGPRAVVTTASYEARAAYGIGSAMPLSRARRLCPDIAVVPPDFETYRAVSRQVMDVVRSQIDRVEVVGLDEVYLELTGLLAPNASMARVRARIAAETGLTCSIGRGPNKLLAKIASGLRKPGGTVALTREEAARRFADSSPRLIPGIGPKTAERLQAMGVTTIADLCRQPAARLQAAFGERHGADLLRRANFEDESPVEPVRDTKSQSSETTFDYDLSDRSRQLAVLAALAGDLCRRLEGKGLRGRNVAIKVRLDDWTTVTRARTIERPTADPAVVGRVAAELFEHYDPQRPIRLLGVRVAAFEAAASPPEPSATQTQLAF
ncbi:MAG: polymerase [Solirubrobacteraceae bacterium]|nr:polymerase [Solirubrobacteraceae bacterium]